MQREGIRSHHTFPNTSDPLLFGQLMTGKRRQRFDVMLCSLVFNKSKLNPIQQRHESKMDLAFTIPCSFEREKTPKEKGMGTSGTVIVNRRNT